MPSTLLNLPKGIDSIPSSQIPKVWDSDWFSKFISLWLAQSDLRNASGSNGITITGSGTEPGIVSFNASTSYTWSGTSTFTGPFIVQKASGNSVTISLVQTGVATWAINNPSSGTDLELKANNTTRLTLTYNGNLVIPAPVSGRCLTIADNTLLRTTVSFSNGAAAAAGTLTNAPTAGNPTKWIPIDDNGTTRYIPAW